MLFLDIETYSDLDLRKVAVDRYASHPSTRILMCAYAGESGPVEIWQEGDTVESGVCHCGAAMEGHSLYDNHAPLDNPYPTLLNLKRTISEATCIPWNKGFEEQLLRKVWKLEAREWQDAMVWALYAGLPAQLKECNKVPYFATDAVTSKETLLINKFCKPSKNGAVHNRETDPEDWAAFCDYCKRDVADTRLIYQWLTKRYTLPERVVRAWQLDQKINRRGMPVDRLLTVRAQIEAERLQAEAYKDLQDLTGLENPNSPAQLLKWVSARGYPYGGLGKELVKKALEGSL